MAKVPDRTDNTDSSGEPPKLHSLVVVGASAGGVEALTTLVSTLPVGFPAPIVLAQHLDPHQPSHLGEILARYSHLPVQSVTDQVPLAPGTIYVIPADRHVEVTDHELRLRAGDPGTRPKPSINLLFSSAAQAYGEQLVAVILTGTGSDGASGAYQVKAAGGVVIIENPETAAYPALPASLAPTTVDFVTDLERIGPLLNEIVTGSGLPMRTIFPSGTAARAEEQRAEAQRAEAQRAEEISEQTLQRLLDRVRKHSSIDFSQYKLPTILRRLQRRIYATGTSNLPEYTHYLDSHPEEYHRLVGSFLIKVTGFFRDAELYAAISERILPELINEARKRGNVLRIWSAGCATGEEAYSLGILVSEALGEDLNDFTVQIFATDVDEDAIEFARHGIYPTAALTGISRQRLARYFLKLDGNYQVSKPLRAMVIFGLHDLGLRAPFPHINLVLCRNVLMYFTKDLQARALQLFAYSLRNDGYLVLGTAETASPLAPYFTQVSPSMKLYRRQGEQILGPIPSVESLQDMVAGIPRHRLRMPSAADIRPPARAPAAPKYTQDQQDMVLQKARSTSERLGLLLLGLSIGVVVVDRHYDIQIINASAMHLLGLYTEAVGEDLIHLAQEVPSSSFRAAIDAAFAEGQAPILSSEVLQQPTVSGEDDISLQGVITVEALLGERRSLQFTCYPYVRPSRIWAAQPEQKSVGEQEQEQEAARAAAAEATYEAAAGVQRRPTDVPLVLIMIRDVTDVVRAREEAVRVVAEQQAASQATQARVQTELEKTAQRLQSENARLKAEVDRQTGINRVLLEGNQKLAEANLELRATNENLQLSEEEAEASSEEVKTLNEELQATNEELVTVNEELEATIEELHAANDELQARARELQELGAALETQHAAPDPPE